MRDIITKEGFDFAFDASACGRCNGSCCRGESGYIWVSASEIEALANYLNISTKECIESYLKKEGYRYTIKEKKRGGEFFCLFFDEKRGCTIYPVRPNQCRTYPFWNYFKQKKHLGELCKECIGILPKS